MLHDEIRAARIRAGLSQSTLAKLAKVPRSQLRKLEDGGNVTLVTVEKILAQLPGTQLTLGERQPDEGPLRDALATLVDAARRVLAVLDGKAAPAPRVADQGPVGATRLESSVSKSEIETARRLEALVEAEKKRPKRDH